MDTITESRADLRGIALVVDDELPNRLILKAMLGRQGFKTVEAGDGREAIERFVEVNPDLVFLDVMMPEMDGYATAREIKRISRERFVPVIFLTALSEGEAMTESIAAGGDDFLSKPFDPKVLAAKIQALERIRALHREIEGLYGRMRQDEEIAYEVFEGAVMADNVAQDVLRTHLNPADIFGGDLFLSAYSPGGDLHLLLGDFSGHGLSAALGALPTAEVFRAMTAKGFPPERILAAINTKLHGLLPTRMYLAADFVQVPRSLDQLRVINCGLPEALVLDGGSGEVKASIPSASLPLGILAEVDYAPLVQSLPIAARDRLLLITDGVVEAMNPAGEMFGPERLERALKEAAPAPLLETLVARLEAYCAGAAQADDISLVEVPCEASLFPVAQIPTERDRRETEEGKSAGNDGSWCLELCVEGPHLGRVDPVPLLLNQVREMEGKGFDHSHLFTILSELFVNALDHGILNLDSRLKADPQGFGEYFEARRPRLAALTEGSVRIHLCREPNPAGWQLRIRVEDSGPGFDPATLDAGGEGAFHGRGLSLVRSLCASVEFCDPGNQIEAVYVVSV